VYFKSSPDDLEYLRQCKCYVNGCYTVLFKEHGQEKKSVHVQIFFQIFSIQGWLDSTADDGYVTYGTSCILVVII
jgi:hypothetical protein